MISDKDIAKNVLNQIKKYLPSNSETEHHSKEIEKIIKSKSKEKKKLLIRHLLQWNNDNFLYEETILKNIV